MKVKTGFIFLNHAILFAEIYKDESVIVKKILYDKNDRYEIEGKKIFNSRFSSLVKTDNHEVIKLIFEEIK